jgi:hypothetical protein
VTIWVVRHGDDLYVRSFKGRDGAWFRGTQVRHEGHIRAGGVDKDVAFEEDDHAIDDEIDAAYCSKYHQYGARYVDPHGRPCGASRHDEAGAAVRRLRVPASTI